MAYRMTAARKAALRKAQLASARKRRRKRGGKIKRAGKELKRRYQAGHTGPGARYRRTRDYYNSTGYYSTRSGGSKKKPGKLQRRYRKVNAVLANTNYGSAAALGVSYVRNKRASKKRKRR